MRERSDPSGPPWVGDREAYQPASPAPPPQTKLDSRITETSSSSQLSSGNVQAPPGVISWANQWGHRPSLLVSPSKTGDRPATPPSTPPAPLHPPLLVSAGLSLQLPTPPLCWLSGPVAISLLLGGSIKDQRERRPRASEKQNCFQQKTKREETNQYRRPLNNMGLNSVGPLTCGSFFK